VKTLITLFSLVLIFYLESGQNILIIGGGAREHALAWKAAQSPLVDKVWIASGNGGTAIENRVENLPISSLDTPRLLAFAQEKRIDLTIVGPETSLATGIVDAFAETGLRCLGPSLLASQLEISKHFAKQFMMRHHIPTAHYASFTQFEPAVAYVQHHALPLVIKADGLAQGKGVVVAQTEEQAIDALQKIMVQKIFGASGDCVIIEEYLAGEELSYTVLTDGDHILPLATAQDHKRLNDGDQGPNTGGMGAYSPVSLVTPEIENGILDTIVLPTIKGMRAEGVPYTGFLYVGLMLTEEGPKVLEYNCRLGDPEAAPLLMRLRSDLVATCHAALDHTLDQIHLDWDPRTAASVVVASHYYPHPSPRADVIHVPLLESNEHKIFHGSTQYDMGQWTTSGGRALCVTALAPSILQALDKTYSLIHLIGWPNMHFRKDIGYRECEREKLNFIERNRL
jgi:phosphoribosylamine---glycine ligase